MRAAWSTTAALLATLGVAAPAQARREASVGVELGGARGQATESSPRESTGTLSLLGELNVSRDWGLYGRLSYTRETAQAPQDGAAFGVTPGNVFLLNAGAEYAGLRHWVFNGSVSGSPPSSQSLSAPVQVEGPLGGIATADARVLTRSASEGVALAATFLSHTEPSLEDLDDLDLDLPRFETQVTGSAGVTAYQTTQRITEIDSRLGVVTVAQAEARCAQAKTAAARRICKALAAGRSGQRDAVAVLPLSLTVNETLLSDTDVALTGTVYVYSGDPLDAGYFSVSSAGKSTVSFGTGMPLAPLRASLRPEVAHEFGEVVRLSLSYERGLYLDDLGHSDALTAKVRWKVSRHWRVLLSVSGQRDVDSEGAVSPAGQATVGARYQF
jgi:hypothetical protein